MPALVAAAGELESAKLSYLSTALADSGSRELLDDMRASAARHHYTTDTVVKVCIALGYDFIFYLQRRLVEAALNFNFSKLYAA